MAIRLAAAEREQIEAAARAQDMAVGAFIRSASLQASAVVLGRVRARPRPAPAPRALPVIETAPEPKGHYVDGERVR
jgi:hypothetical protein